MESLRELIQLLTPRERRAYCRLENPVQDPGKDPSKEIRLLRGIAEGSYPDDRAAAFHLYQTNPGDPRYRSLKFRAEEKLLDHLCRRELDRSQFPTGRDPARDCEWQLHQARALRRMGSGPTAERLLNRALRTAQTHEFTSLTVACLELLLEIHAQRGDALRYRRTRETLLGCQQTLANERAAWLLYQETQFQLAGANGREEPLTESLSAAVEQLQRWWQRTRSFACYDLFYRLYVRWLELAGHYDCVVSLASQSEVFLAELKVNAARFDHQHNHCAWVRACLRTGAVGAGLQLAGRGGPLFEPNTGEWFAHWESYLLLALHGENYALATELIRQVEDNPSLARLPTLPRERWQLYRAYLDWMHPDGADRRPEASQFGQLTPGCYQDKAGYCVAILILEFGGGLRAGQLDWLRERASIYQKHLERHLGAPAQARERLFLQLLLLVVRHDFREEKVSRKSVGLLNRLKQCRLPGGACRSNVEVVPYEHLWQRVVALLSPIGGQEHFQGGTLKPGRIEAMNSSA